MSLPHQSGNESRASPSRRSRRSTSDIASAAAAKEGKRWSLATAFAPSRKPSNADANAFPGSLPSFVDPVVANDLHQLNKYALKIRSAAKNVSHVDSAWNDYVKHKERCLECCRTLITPPSQRRESSIISPTTTTQSDYQREVSLDALNLVAIDTSSSTHSSGSRGDHGDQCQKAVGEWETTVELLAGTLRASLQETYYEYDKEATLEGFEKLCTDKAVRHNAIYHMRNASLCKVLSADMDFFPKYDVRFRNYDEIQKDLARVRSLLGTSGIPQSKTIIERRISPTGDAMLEFANAESEAHPVFRFRVASHCLREASSPIFGHMFNAHFRAELDDDTRRGLPPSPPTRYVCGDGREVMLYRMPQTELNTERALEILLHAAHNHNDRVPRDVPFRQFVAIAEACLRYRCTAPLELAVEHLWLPRWWARATDDMLAGVLLISYVFGLAENFTRLSRIAILNMTGPDDAGLAPWPQRVGERMAAVYRLKMEQVYEQCRTTLNEYFCPGPGPDDPEGGDARAASGVRCPAGDRACDARNLGWFMKSLGELGLFEAVLLSPALGRPPQQRESRRSLLGVISALSLITGPPSVPPPQQQQQQQQQQYGRGGSCGACDFAPAFRAAIRDVYEDVPGLTLLEVAGRRGWALSKDRSPRHSTQGQGRGGAGAGGATQQQQQTEQLFEIAARPRGIAPVDDGGGSPRASASAGAGASASGEEKWLVEADERKYAADVVWERLHGPRVPGGDGAAGGSSSMG
ncbi:hypothetical protein F4802DRAFT_606828 [Xylaria palmicola]|nr:hypothetical protein F4802DRAFT_606828 [Xylaria palmicola]